MRLPRGFKAHDGGECPVDPGVYVETLIRTSQGIGSGGVTQARIHDWVAANHADGLGAVLAYRMAVKDEEAHFHAHARWKAGNHPKREQA